MTKADKITLKTNVQLFNDEGQGENSIQLVGTSLGLIEEG